MDIVIATDNRYVMPACTMLYSICINNRESSINFHAIIDSSFTERSKESILRILEPFKRNISYHIINSDSLKECPVGRDGLPASAYFRLFVSDIFPKEIKKLLYLDCDIIVRHSLKDLWNYDIKDYAIGCVPDMYTDDISPYNRLKYLPQDGYFNSGVLIINLEYWREHNVKELFIDFIRNYKERILYSDQDVMNYVLRNNKLNLPFRYNVQDGFLWKDRKISWIHDEELENAILDPIILHFSTRNKPWIKGCTQPLKDEFFKYREKTEWANSPLWTNPEKNIFKETIKSILQKMRILKRTPSIYRIDIKPL